MNIIVKQVYDIVRSSRHFANYNVYMHTVPEDDQKKSQLPIMRISELDSYSTGFASNKSKQHSFSVQVDVWHTSLEEINKIYFVIDELMEEYKFVNTAGGTDEDIDFNNTSRMYKRYRTRQNK